MKIPLELLRRMRNWQPERKLRLGYSPTSSKVRVRGAGDGAQWTLAVCGDRKDGEKLPGWGGAVRDAPPAEGELSRGKEVICRGLGQQKRYLEPGVREVWAQGL